MSNIARTSPHTAHWSGRHIPQFACAHLYHSLHALSFSPLFSTFSISLLHCTPPRGACGTPLTAHCLFSLSIPFLPNSFPSLYLVVIPVVYPTWAVHATHAVGERGLGHTALCCLLMTHHSDSQRGWDMVDGRPLYTLWCLSHQAPHLHTASWLAVYISRCGTGLSSPTVIRPFVSEEHCLSFALMSLMFVNSLSDAPLPRTSTTHHTLTLSHVSPRVASLGHHRGGIYTLCLLVFTFVEEDTLHFSMHCLLCMGPHTSLNVVVPLSCLTWLHTHFGTHLWDSRLTTERKAEFHTKCHSHCDLWREGGDSLHTLLQYMHTLHFFILSSSLGRLGLSTSLTVEGLQAGEHGRPPLDSLQPTISVFPCPHHTALSKVPRLHTSHHDHRIKTLLIT